MDALRGLSPESWARAAELLDAEVAAVRAVARVEAGPWGAFLRSGEPVILFERHLFRRETGGRYDAFRVPGLGEPEAIISSPRTGGWGPLGVQHKRLAAAAALDRPAALRSTSWGLFQILGRNHALAGFPRLEDFVAATRRDVDAHLAAFVAFVASQPRMARALREKDWATFARLYNGPAYRANEYDLKLAAAYEAEQPGLA